MSNRFQIERNLWFEQSNRDRITLPNLFERICDRRTAKWWSAGQTFIEYRSD